LIYKAFGQAQAATHLYSPLTKEYPKAQVEAQLTPSALRNLLDSFVHVVTQRLERLYLLVPSQADMQVKLEASFLFQ
jgi:hypothetical protein